MALVAATQVEFWKKYISFERSNPLRSEDTALVTKRVMFATEQCLLVLTHHPAVWHQAAQYLDQSSKNFTEKGVRIKISLLNPSDLCFRRLVCLANFYPAPLKSMGGQWPLCDDPVNGNNKCSALSIEPPICKWVSFVAKSCIDQ